METREFGEHLHVSVGTALALETLLKPTREKYELLYLNIRTLWRNYLGSYNKDLVMSSKEHTDVFKEELEIVLSFMRSALVNKDIRLYGCTYKNATTTLKYAKVKQYKTPKQMKEKDLEDLVITNVLESTEIKVFDSVLTGPRARCLILTHVPLDLLSYRNFRSLYLLESHTGTIKGREDWTKKLSKNPLYANLPFNLFTLQVIGDNNVISNGGKKLTGPVLEMATKGHWNATTSTDRILYDISKMKDPYLKEVLRTLARATLK